MKCRNITTHKSVVWFNSAGKHYSSIRVHLEGKENPTIDVTLTKVTDVTYESEGYSLWISSDSFVLNAGGTYVSGSYDLYGRLKFTTITDQYDSAKSFFAWKSIKAENFATKQHAVASSLTQKLSILRSELWYSINYGMPLLEKQKSKLTIDSFISSVVLDHDDVVKILSFSSSVTNHKYSCNMQILSTYGEIDLTI